MNDRSIALIFGYVARADFVNPAAAGCGLPWRFGLALDTYRRERADMFFDRELLLALLPGILQVVDYDRLQVLDNGDRLQDLAAIGDLFHRPAPAEEDDEPFLHLKAIHGERIVCYAETEFYTRIGGPHPYHDTYTFSFYFAGDHRAALQSWITQYCRENDILIRDIMTANPEPVPRNKTVWAKLKTWWMG